MGRGTSLKREQVITAIHLGMAKAARRFQRWTDGGSVADWGVECLLTTYCAEALAAAAKAEGATFSIGVEENFRELLMHSDRAPKLGRRSHRRRDLEDHPNRRVDLALWNRHGAPRGLIELKRDANLRGLRADAKRLADFMHEAGIGSSGSLRFGLLGVLVHTRATPSERVLDQMIRRRQQLMSAFAATQNLKVRKTERRVQRIRAGSDHGRLATIVFEFYPPR